MNLRIELLTRRHDRAGFGCGDETIDLFLQQKAMQDQDLDLGRTSVLIDLDGRHNEILGYHTLTMHQVPQEEIPDDRPKIKRGIPTILLGQLGVAVQHQGKRHGEFLLSDAQARVLEISEVVGVRAMVLDARTERLVSWYASHGFVRLNGSLRMVKRVETMRLERVRSERLSI